MNHGINIRYDYTGDEAPWAEAIDGFLKNIANDPRLKGRFEYMVTIAKEGPGRIHVGRWDEMETVQYLQSTEFFKEFAATLKGFAGDTLKPTPFRIHASNY